MLLEKMMWEIIHVPDKDPTLLQGSTVNVVASAVEPKLANMLVRRLCQVAPLENLRHVKRVRRRTFEAGNNELSIILCPTFGDENQLEGIPDDVQRVINDYQLRPFIAKVAKYAASSKEEWEDQCKLWPTSYHPMPNADAVAGFTPEESQWIVRCMKITLNLAKLKQLLGQQAVNAAVIVDPSSRQIVTSAIDQTSSETSTSNIMETSGCTKDTEIISFSEFDEDEVDYCQAFRLCTSDEFTQSCLGVSCLYPWSWLEQNHHNGNTTVNHGGKYSWHPLRHAALVAIENAAARDRQLFPNPAHLENHPNSGSTLKDSFINLPSKRQKTQETENEEKPVQEDSEGCSPELMRPYLCTGFDIYLVWEPCTMCAMALVHQRIRRIFFAFPNPNAGALGSIHRLQGERSLNHHYSVFRVSVRRE